MFETLRLLHDQVAVVPLPLKLTHGSLVLPETQEWFDLSKGQAIQGTVVAVGLGDKLGTLGAMKINARPIGRKQWESAQQQMIPFGPTTCPKCQCTDEPHYRVMTNQRLCALCGHLENRFFAFYPHLPAFGHQTGAMVIHEDKLYEWQESGEWREIDISARRAPMHVKVGDKVLFWPTDVRQRRTGDVSYYILHEEQHIVAVLEEVAA